MTGDCQHIQRDLERYNECANRHYRDHHKQLLGHRSHYRNRNNNRNNHDVFSNNYPSYILTVGQCMEYNTEWEVTMDLQSIVWGMDNMSGECNSVAIYDAAKMVMDKIPDLDLDYGDNMSYHCCTKYVELDSLLSAVQADCTADDVTNYGNEIQKYINHLEEKRCAAYKYTKGIQTCQK
ncbi:unnamed protein product [Medioppia subpectinata]|uniref:Uncharacterized protein n=1 Tax=Medioppia subpectinata TaxID=1979941 RepID=A0A7R9KP12_9ACAR|nr:unnamed protein product [Medioppia subpectinata]CAG2105716.1 unnamed protein product [Medioppia subpectinata]